MASAFQVRSGAAGPAASDQRVRLAYHVQPAGPAGPPYHNTPDREADLAPAFFRHRDEAIDDAIEAAVAKEHNHP